MKAQSILIVDDEKSIRLTLSQSLEMPGLDTDTAVNGEEALAKLKKKEYGLILLDLKMPGMDGMEVLREVTRIRPDIRVIIITAHGTIDSAVEAMKYGAVDFIQKPFAPKEIRELVLKVLDRDAMDEANAADYSVHIELAKRCVSDRHFRASTEHVRKAIAIDASRPEAFNFLGALQEIQGHVLEAQKNYRAALSLDPTYKPAHANLMRVTHAHSGGEIVLDEAPSSGGGNV